jgi:acetyl-CoA acyltransferase
MEAMGKLQQLFPNGPVTAGNASGVNDRTSALLPASEAGIRAHGLRPIRRYLGGATEVVPPRVLVLGPGPFQPVADCSA